MWRIGEQQEKHFRDWCEKIANQEKLWQMFKRHPVYQPVIGYDSLLHADQCYTEVKKIPEVFANLTEFAKNDSVGKDFLSPLKIGERNLSYNVIRHAHTVSLLYTHFGNLNDKTILEVGPGWGGLLYCLSVQWPKANLAMVDLPEHSQLTKKYLAELGVKKILINPPDLTPDIFIAEYSISELDDATIEDYWQNYLQGANGFLLRWNTFTANRNHYWLERFQSKFEVTTSMEHRDRSQNFIWIGKAKNAS